MIDLRSDTVTRPSTAMLKAMSAAEVGDDVWGDDSTVKHLQDTLAERTGKEAGLFLALSELAVEIASSGSFGEAERWGDAVAIAFEETTPAQVVVEILGGDAVEAAQPGFQATVVGIDVLDVEDAFEHPNALLYVQRSVRYAGHAGEGFVGVGPVRAKNRIGIDQRPEHGDDMRCIEPLQAKVGRLAAAIPNHQDGNLVGAGASCPSDTAASASRPR